MSITAALFVTSGSLGMSGIVDTIVNFNAQSPWYYVGLLLVGMAGTTGLAGTVMTKRARINTAFDIGFDAGFKRGRCVGRPVVVDLDDRERLRERQRDGRR